MRRQAITWPNADPLLIGSLGTNFSEMLIKIKKQIILKNAFQMSSVKWRPFCPGQINQVVYERIVQVLGTTIE